jgi:hypothetical protein
MTIRTLVHRLIHITARYLLERALRIPDVIRPSFYIGRLRIKAITAGKKRFPGGNYAIFAIRPHHSVPKYIYNAIDVLNQLKFNVVVVTNRELLKCDQSALAANTSFILTRNGRGRDFAGFKDGIDYIRSYEAPNSLLLLNDSVYYIARFLLPALKELTSSSGFAAFAENYEFHYHAQSNCLFFSHDAIKDARFQRFWRRYRPFSTRIYAINKGEVAISKHMLKGGFSPVITFNRQRLIQAIGRLSFHGLLELVRLFPNSVAGEMKVVLTDVRRSRFQALLKESYQRKGGELNAIGRDALEVDHLIGDALDDTTSMPIHECYVEALRRAVVEKVNELMADRNTLHACGLILTKYTQLPAIKRDVIHRNTYCKSTLEDLVAEIAPELLEDVKYDARIRKNSKYHSPIRKLLDRYGML